MIKLIKGNEPAVLRSNKRAWTEELRDLQNRGEKVPESLSTKYNQDEVKEALRAESYSKCMYCESKVEHISDLQIEHIKPKAKDKYPDLTFEFQNIGLACGICNRNKGNKYDINVPFINPYLDNPETHFYCLGALIWAKPGDSRAKLTEDEIELNRPDLLEERNERLKTIRMMIELYQTEMNPTLKESIKKQIIREIDRDKIYSYCTRSYVKQMMPL